MKFYKKKKKFDPYEEAILRVFARLDKKVTPSEIAAYLRIHPNTAKSRIKKLWRRGYLKCKRERKKLYCEKGRKKIPF